GGAIDILTSNIASLAESAPAPETPLQVFDRLLIAIGTDMRSFDSDVKFTPDDYPRFYLRSPGELYTILTQLNELRYIELSGLFEAGHGLVKLTIDGWKRLQEIRSSAVESWQAFVAMWFSDQMRQAWEEGIKPALESTGYVPLRVDQIEHNDKIDDKIVAELRRSGLVVADFTGHRGGVYFEAGYAAGRGIPVIWCCQKSDLGNAHFDTRQYNHIEWETPDQLREKLENRIRATLPTRPSQTVSSKR
ncbi:MAG: hypothetical protein QJR03_13855, partial [Sphaerobacter sp.]|nr:hypothetical protein [Sphaerobacter sp.]